MTKPVEIDRIHYACTNCQRYITVVIFDPPIVNSLDPVWVQPHYFLADRIMRRPKPAPIRVCRECADRGWGGHTIPAPETADA